MVLPKLKELEASVEAEARGVFVYIPGLEEKRQITSMEGAEALDRPKVLERFAREVAAQVKGDTHVILPFVGYRRVAENVRHLEEATGAKVVELPSVPPSLAGRRLMMALESVAKKHGVKMYKGYTATSAVVEKGECTAVKASWLGEEITIKAKAFILATGDYISGGLAASETDIVEPIFGLKIKVPPGMDYLSWTEKTPFPPTGHPYSFFGVEVDELLRPLADGEPVAENVFACGSILAHYDYNTEKSGSGVCVSTALAAAKNARR